MTKKWKCSAAGEKSCFVVLKLDQPRIISGIDIGNERSGFIEVLVGNSKQDPPNYKEILLATSFMTIIEAKNGNNPNRVRCFTNNILVESVAKHKWDLIKIVCSQPFNSKIQYGLSFITLHTPEEIKNDDSPAKPAVIATQAKAEDSSEKKVKFGKFNLRAESDSDDDSKKKKDSPSFNRWKSSKSGSQENKVSIKDQMKAKLEENRKRIRVVPDSSDEEVAKQKPKPNRNRSGLVYEDEDDEPNERLQKKLDKDNERREKEQKTPKTHSKRDKTPPRSDSKKSKFSSFIDDDLPSTSSRDRSPSRSNKPSFSSSSSSKKSPKKSPRREKESEKKSPRTLKEPEKKSASATLKEVSYKPFHKLLEGVVFAFSGYVNPERGILRQKALDMGAKYRPDWDTSCSHLM